MSKVIHRLMLAGLDLLAGARFTELPISVTEAKGGDGLSEQWPESRFTTTTDLESADHVCSNVTKVEQHNYMFMYGVEV